MLTTHPSKEGLAKTVFKMLLKHFFNKLTFCTAKKYLKFQKQAFKV